MNLTKKSYAIIFFIFLVSVFFNSCSNSELTRSKAEKLLKAKFKELNTDAHYDIFYTKSVLKNTDEIKINGNISALKELQEKGLITYTINLTIKPDYTVFLIKFTDKGKQYSKAAVSDATAVIDNSNSNITDNNETIDVETYFYEFDQITGIKNKKESNTAEVQFTKKFVVTPFGKQFYSASEVIVNCTATFTKFDDGWRLEDDGSLHKLIQPGHFLLN